MEHGRNRRLVIAIILVAVVLITIGGTFAYFLTTADRNEEQKLTIKTGNLALTFEDNDSGLTGGIMIGESKEKLFIIRNTGTEPVTTNMIWDGLVNTYLEESLSYTLEYKTNETGTYQALETAQENVPQSDRADDFNLAKNITIPARSTYYYKLTIIFNNLPDINQEADRTAILSTKFNLGEEVPKILASQKILSISNPDSITNYEDGNTKEMYAIKQAKTNSTKELTDYRYIGANPNNYLKFNDETWRIIGVFTIGEQTKIKIIRNEKIGDIAWNTNRNNDWVSSTLNNKLNSSYFNRTAEFEQIGLNEVARNQIDENIWYIGATKTASGSGAKAYYNFERSGTLAGAGTKTNITTKIGLAYPSDYGFTFANGVDNICYSNLYNCHTPKGGTPSTSWMYNDIFKNNTVSWFITPSSDDNIYSFYVSSTGFVVYGGNQVNQLFSVVPTLYLNSNILIKKGDGSKNNPYILANN